MLRTKWEHMFKYFIYLGISWGIDVRHVTWAKKTIIQSMKLWFAVFITAKRILFIFMVNHTANIW